MILDSSVRGDQMAKKKNSDENKSSIQEKKNDYPSAELLLGPCMEDYQRIQDNYNKIYEKINIALAFSGIILTIMLGNINLEKASILTQNMRVGELILIIVELGCTVGSVGLVLLATIKMLILLLGRIVSVFKSEDLRNNEIYREENQYSALWMIDKYTTIVSEMRPIVQRKQKKYDRAIVIMIIGVVLYAVSIILQKGGL